MTNYTVVLLHVSVVRHQAEQIEADCNSELLIVITATNNFSLAWKLLFFHTLEDNIIYNDVSVW